VSIYTVSKYLRDRVGPRALVLISPEEVDELGWQDRALCAQTDPAIFFPSEGESAGPAKAVCAVCPSRLPCLEWSLERDELGVWGGMSRAEREREQQRREAAA